MLVSIDLKAIEWRVLLYLAQDLVGIQEILDNQDAHALNQKAFDLPSRLIAKIYLFRTIYRGSGWSFAHDPAFMHVSNKAAYWDTIGEKFYTKYYGINACHQKWADIVMSGQPIVGPFGREWEFNIRDKRGEIYVPWTTLTNYPVQGTAADIMALCRVIFHRRLQRLNIPVLLVSTVHDSIVVDTPDEYTQVVVNLFHQVVDVLVPNIRKLYGIDWNVPLAGETNVGLNEKDMREMQRNDI